MLTYMYIVELYITGTVQTSVFSLKEQPTSA